MEIAGLLHTLHRSIITHLNIYSNNMLHGGTVKTDEVMYLMYTQSAQVQLLDTFFTVLWYEESVCTR